ncbi:ABC transporter substrate-binding protein [Microbacterium pseudoresistens]|uniref:Multiple sugar transport system substrate-binding protein n=1 Tax=Microbacterium pseudoresistens TaxID=640634 RepID=A0A7Y9ET62_9MICO|nr:multiple sugar transport system substrate-binding protein [Microbacterium pseudoresistens]
MRRRIIGATALVATAALVAGCAGPSGSSGGEGSSGEPVELRFLLWATNPDQLALFDELGEEFVAENDDVSKVTFESVTLSDLNTLLPTWLASNSPPDASWLPVESSIEYMNADALVDLNPTLKDVEGYDYDDLADRMQEPWRDGDAQFGVPFSNGPLIMYYNKDLFDQSGLEDPSAAVEAGTWDWDLLREDLQKISADSGKTGLIFDAFEFKNWVRMLPLIRAYGGTPWDENGEECLMDSSEMEAAYSALHEMVYDEKITPRPGQQADFWGGGAATTIAYLGSNGLLADVDFEYGVVPTPAGPGGAGQHVGQSAMVAYSAGKHTDAAARLVAYLTNPESMRKLSAYYPPSRTSLLNAETMEESAPVLDAAQLEPILTAVLENGTFTPVAPNNAETTAALNAALDQFVYGEDADIPAALQQVCAAIQPTLGG